MKRDPDPPPDELRKQTREARMEAGYRQDIGPLVDEQRREELSARLRETQAKMDEIQRSLDARRDPTWIIALRVAAAVVVWAGLVALGARFGGLWGALGALVVPLLLPLLWVVASHLVAALARGPRMPVGDLSAHLALGKRRVVFYWTGDEWSLPLALLACLDRAVWTWPGDAASRRELLAAARLVTEARLRGEPVSVVDAKAERGAELRGRPESLVMLKRDRLGVEYWSRHTLGGPASSLEGERTMALALLEHALWTERGDEVARAALQMIGRYEEGAREARKVIRKLGRSLARRA